MRHLATTLFLFTLATLVGCFETKTPLGPREQAKVDREFCGDWQIEPTDKSQERGKIVIRNIDAQQYLVELQESGKPPAQMVGYIVDVKDVHIAHVRDLPEDGALKDSWLLMRVQLDGANTMMIRQFNDKFFEGKPHDTAEQLRAIVEANLD
ncbi:MAG: hypothetical protein ACREJC_00350, partial [Tepidisphaeraceae bacterium]